MAPHQAAARPNATAARGAQDGATGILDIDTLEPVSAQERDGANETGSVRERPGSVRELGGGRGWKEWTVDERN